MKKFSIVLFVVITCYSCKDVITSSITNDKNDSVAYQSTNNNSMVTESIFMLTDTFQNQQANKFVLTTLKGKPTVVGMVFTHCGYACPRLTSDMISIAEKLKGDRNKVNFVLVSFDTERDTPSQLQKFQKQMDLDENWILLHGNEQTVRTLSVLLNVQFEKDAEGNFSHSNIVTVLDKNGVLKFQKEGLEVDHSETILKLKELIN